jgi:hypothetical protein
MNEALAKAIAEMDAHIERALADAEILLRDHGATDEELEAEMAIQRADALDAKARTIAEIQEWFDDIVTLH